MNISTGVTGYLSIHARQYRNVVVIMVTPAYRTRKYAVIDNAVDRYPARDRGRDICVYVTGLSTDPMHTRARRTSDWISLIRHRENCTAREN